MDNINNLQEYKYRVIFVLGAPGSGKNTQCDNLIQKYNFIHFSCGDLLREAALKDDEDGKLINYYIKEGLIVPVRITCKLAKNKMDLTSGKNIFLIDGFPRNKENLDGWIDTFGDSCKILAVLFLECSVEICTERIKKRSIYSGRTDDNDESLKKRFRILEETTIPNLENLKKYTNIIKVKSEESSEEVLRKIINEFDKLLQ